VWSKELRSEAEVMMEGESKKSRDRTPSKPLLESIETHESPDQSSDSDTESADPAFKCIPCLRLFNTDAELKKHEKTQTHQNKVDNTVRKKKEVTPEQLGSPRILSRTKS
jgi:hypothetical protein